MPKDPLEDLFEGAEKDPIGDLFAADPDQEQERFRTKTGLPKRSGHTLDELEQIATQQGVDPGTDPQLGLFSRAVNFVNAANFAIAGATEEIAKGRGAAAAGKRGLAELGQGVVDLTLGGTLKVPGAEQEGFGKVFKDLGIPAGPRVSDVAPIDKGSLFDVTARGAGGLALDIATDPLTFTTLGAGAVSKTAVPLRVGGETLGFLTKKGVKKLAAETERITPKAQKLVENLKLSPTGDVSPGGLATFLRRDRVGLDAAEDIASRNKAIGEFEAGSKQMETLTEEALTNRMATRLAEKNLVRDVQAGKRGLVRPETGVFVGVGSAKAAIPGTPAIGRFLKTKLAALNDVVFNDTKLSSIFLRNPQARKIPQFNAMLQGAVDEKAFRDASIGQALDSVFTKPLKPLGNEGRVGVWRSIMLHIDNPKNHPIETVPEQFRYMVSAAKYLMNQIRTDEVGKGLLENVRANYIPHLYTNTPEQIAEVFRRFGATQNQVDSFLRHGTVGGFAEHRIVPTLDQAMAAGLTPNFNLPEVLFIRARAHNNAMVADEFFTTVKRTFGKDSKPAMREVFEETMPGVLRIIDEGLPATKAAKITGPEFTTLSKLTSGKTFRQSPEGIKAVNGLSDLGKSIFLRDRMAKVKGMRELHNTFNKYSDAFLDLNPRVFRELNETLSGVPESAVAIDASGAPMRELARIAESGAPKAIRKLEGVLLPDPIARELESFGIRDWRLAEAAPSLAKAIKAWDYILNTTKVSLTVPFPQFHFRNAYSNIAQNMLDIGVQAVNPARHLAVTRIMTGREGTIVANTGRRYTYEAIRQLAKRHKVTIDPKDFLEFTGKDGIRKSGVIRNGARHIFSAIENEARMVNFISNLRNGLKPLEAAERTKKFLFDYQNISTVEREFLSRLIPFYRWTRKNIPLQLGSLIKRPGRIANITKPFRPQNSGPDREALPEYLRGDLQIKFQTPKGKPAFVSGIDLPISDLDKVWAGSLQKTTATNLSQLAPLAKMMLEIGTDTDLFTGRNFSEKHSDVTRSMPFLGKMPQAFQDYLEIREIKDAETGESRFIANPTKMYLTFKSWVLARVFNTLERGGDKNTTLDAFALSALTSLRVREFDMTEVQQRELRRRVRVLEQRLKSRGVGRTFERFFIPKGEFESTTGETP